ncbi:MAG: DEAD/DEAH box helicase [Bacteroidales bacterium]
MDKKFFALGLTEHRIWGLVLMPLMLSRDRENSFFKPDHTVFPIDSDENFLSLSNTEKKIVRIIDEYSDQKLFSLFSKHKNVKEFQVKVKKENIDYFIRPYIEKKLYQVLEIIRGTNIKVFLREKTRSNVFEEDFLQVLDRKVFPVFHFTKTDEEASYSLQLFSEKGRISLKDKYFDIITDHPASLRINDKIVFVNDIEAKKIKPFFTKDRILIPEKTVIQYFKSFAKKIIRDYEVNATGFDINLIDPERKAQLSLERTLQNGAGLVLSFGYADKIIYSSSNTKVFVDFHQDRGDFYYDKYKRDFEWEQSCQDLLNDLGLISFDQVNYVLKKSHDLSFEEQVYNLVEWINRNYQELIDNEIIVHQRIKEKNLLLENHRLDIRSKLKNDWFDIYAEIHYGEHSFPLVMLKKHILEFNREYVLPDGSIFVIPLEWFGRFKELFEFGKTEGKGIKLHKQHFFIIEKAEKGLKSSGLDELEKLNRREDLTPAVLPKELNATLRSYQVEGFTWLWYLQQNNLGGCLADDMGLGKTLQAIALLLKNKQEMQRDKPSETAKTQQLDLFTLSEEKLTSLIVVPASLVHNWMNEIRRFAPTLKVYAHVGNQRAKKMNSFPMYDVIISSYHTIRQDIEMISSFPFHYAVLDESQVIKNPSSKLYRAMLLLNAKFRMVLTGTPIENSLTDLWAQLNFINNGLLGSLNFFRREYVNPVERKNDVIREGKLKKLINPFILRRTKEEVARELPEMTEQVILCNMSDEQRRFYDEEKSTIRQSIFERIDQEGIEKSSMIVLQGLTRLRQISNHPVLVDENYREDSGKFSEIIRNIDSVISEGHKVLVFSSFVKHLNLVKSQLDEHRVRYTYLTGESTNREKIIKAFQDNPSCSVFLISLKAGGVGLNLTAADYVFILDPWWNPASEDQAVNRAHRIGQDKNVFVYRFISENSIEEKIQRLQEKKTRLAETFVRSNNPMKEISRRELEELFE